MCVPMPHLPVVISGGLCSVVRSITVIDCFHFQVLVPRVAHLKQSVRELRSMALSSRGFPANCGIIDNPGLVPGDGSSVSTAAVATSSQHQDKAFVEILLDARRFSVVVQHQPLESWLALHGSALRVGVFTKKVDEQSRRLPVVGKGARATSRFRY